MIKYGFHVQTFLYSCFPSVWLDQNTLTNLNDHVDLSVSDTQLSLWDCGGKREEEVISFLKEKVKQSEANFR